MCEISLAYTEHNSLFLQEAVLYPPVASMELLIVFCVWELGFCHAFVLNIEVAYEWGIGRPENGATRRSMEKEDGGKQVRVALLCCTTQQ